MGSNVDHDATVLQSIPGPSATQIAGPPSPDRSPSPTEGAALEHLRSELPRFVATAPGRLDVMGGIGEYTGALVLSMPTSRTTSVAVQPRGDRNLVLHLCDAEGDGESPLTLPLDRVIRANGSIADAGIGHELPDAWKRRGALCVVGSIVEMLRSGLLPADTGGYSVAVASTMTDKECMGCCAAAAAATWTAVRASVGSEAAWIDGAELCRRVECDWLDVPVGIAGGVCALMGQPGAVTQLHCDASKLGDPVALPPQAMIIGVDSGAAEDPGASRYTRVRTEAAMGKALIQRIVTHEAIAHDPFNGRLAHVTVSDFVERFRDRLPTRLKGRDFLDRFGQTDDPLTTIDPGLVYKIRSRVEHHVYENARSHQFVQCLLRAARLEDEQSLISAGELMNASHWSYSQRCGLGTLPTDKLVKLIRGRGVEAGIYGARITGRGCGGSISVLLASADKAMDALQAAVKEYAALGKHQPALLEGSTAGALISGASRA